MTTKQTLIVFDIDGTLTDSVAPHQASFVAALKQMGIGEIDTNFKSYRHHTDMHIARVIYEKDQARAFDEERQNQFERLLFESICLAPLGEIPGALSMIRILESLPEIGICYATGSLRQPAVYKLQQAGIDFDPLQLSASNGMEEREQVVLQAITQARTFYGQDHFERTIAVGDGLWDLVTARNLGLEFIGIGLSNRELLLREGAALHLADWQGFDAACLGPQLNLS